MFAYAPARIETRGVAAREVSPDVRIAAARIEKRARQAATARNLAALGVADLALGNWDKAVEALQDATEQEPADPSLQNDLSVAYLARAAGDNRPEDWASALAAARHAIKLDPQRSEPYFNRALAFHGLHLSFDEREAWADSRASERSRPWAAESAGRQRLAEGGSGASPSAGGNAPDNQDLREQIEDTLLPQWGAAIESGHADAAERLLAESSRLAERLIAAGGDAMPRDEIARITRFASAGDHRTVRDLAIGHRLYGTARDRLLQERSLESSDLMSDAAPHLHRAGSPYWYASSVTRAIALRNKGEAQAALDQLRKVPVNSLPRHYFYLRGRVAWIEGVVQGSLGRYDLTRDLLTRAVGAFQSAAENDNVIAAQTVLAEAEWFLGDRGSAWTQVVAVLSAIDRRGASRRTVHLDLAATMSLGTGLPEAAFEFHRALVRMAATDTARAEAYLRRARTLVRLHDVDAASTDLKRTAEIVSTLQDSAARERITADVEIVRAELFSGVDCRQTIQHSEAALPYLMRTAGTIRRAALLTVRAGCRQSMGDIAGAKADLLDAVGAFETRRSTIRSAADRVQAFELERATFKDLIRLESLRLVDQWAALRTAERSRAGIAEAWGGIDADLPDYRSLPSDVAVVYYESLADRVLVWVLTRERRTAYTQPIGEVELRRSINRIQRVIQQGADLATLRPYSASLVDALVTPALELADRSGAADSPKSTIVFVPDGRLFGLPFGALPDAQGRPLLESRIVTVAPSLKTFVAASARLAAFMPSDVLAVGDGHDAAATGLPLLPRADGEAAAVASIYPHSTLLVGGNATKRMFLSARAHVIHFAGHSVLNERYPMLSRMLLAPDRLDGDSGWLLATEITPQQFGRTDVVVLATCEGAAGAPVEGEGTLSIARAFFAAGVPAVVASLWPLDDDLQTLAQTFHRRLAVERDPARALRAGQRALLAERGPRTPVRVWGGFIMLGGLARFS